MSTATKEKPGFRICGGKGFHITFANGYTVSVQFGPGNYCENHEHEFRDPEQTKRGWPSGTAEIAAWDPNGNMRDWQDWGDSVKGHVTPNEVLAFLNFIAEQP